MPRDDDEPQARRCQRCGATPDDLFRCRVDLKIALLCPGCYADRRLQGHDVALLKEGRS